MRKPQEGSRALIFQRPHRRPVIGKYEVAGLSRTTAFTASPARLAASSLAGRLCREHSTGEELQSDSRGQHLDLGRFAVAPRQLLRCAAQKLWDGRNSAYLLLPGQQPLRSPRQSKSTMPFIRVPSRTGPGHPAIPGSRPVAAGSQAGPSSSTPQRTGCLTRELPLCR